MAKAYRVPTVRTIKKPKSTLSGNPQLGKWPKVKSCPKPMGQRHESQVSASLALLQVEPNKQREEEEFEVESILHRNGKDILLSGGV
jgi:hypothetical protein